MSKAFYGVEFLRTFDPDDAEHVARESTLCELPSGPKLLPDAFDCILKRGLKVKESTVFSRKYSTELTSLSVLSVFEVLIWCYRGKSRDVPTWIYRDAGTLMKSLIWHATNTTTHQRNSRPFASSEPTFLRSKGVQWLRRASTTKPSGRSFFRSRSTLD